MFGQAMTGRKHGQERLALEQIHGEAVLRRLWRAHERRIDPTVAQGAEKVRAQQRPHFDPDGGVLLPESLDQPWDGSELDEWLPADHQVPRLVTCDLSHCFDACIETRQYLAGTVEKVGAEGGEFDPAARTLEQRDLKLALELHDPLAQRRLRHVETIRRSREVELLGHGDEVPKVAQFHGGMTQQAECHHRPTGSARAG
jgi:hypothetical protein